MWPFSKSKLSAPSDIEIEEVIGIIAEKWLTFSSLPFHDNVSLEDRIIAFMHPALDGLVKAKPAFAFMPTEAMLLLFANGIAQSGTHTALEIQDALGFSRN